VCSEKVDAACSFATRRGFCMLALPVLDLERHKEWVMSLTYSDGIVWTRIWVACKRLAGLALQHCTVFWTLALSGDDCTLSVAEVWCSLCIQCSTMMIASIQIPNTLWPRVVLRTRREVDTWVCIMIMRCPTMAGGGNHCCVARVRFHVHSAV
jgi:hypothetical protein